MSGAFGRRTVFDDPFVVPDQSVAPMEFEVPWGETPRSFNEPNRNILMGGVMVRGLDPDVFATPTLERIAEIADNYPTVS